jgi:O-antigen/teichoic acid export membrane protein
LTVDLSLTQDFIPKKGNNFVVSIFASQADKLFLISHATTDQYGFYTIGMQVSNSVGTLASCVYATIFPLFAVSVAYDRCSLPKVRSFLIGTVLMCIVLVPNSLALIIMGTDILNVWLGVSLPETGVLGIRLLIGGTMINSLMLVLVVVQIVNSHMRFSILKNVGILVISWPALGFLYDLYGVAGVAGFWLAQNVVFFLFEPFYICKRFVGFSTLRWYLFPVLIPFCIAAVGGWFIYSRFISFLDVHAYIKFLFLDFLLFLFMIFPTWLLLPQTGFNIKSLIYTTGK